MRKATLIFIILVFIASIMLVNFFGLNSKAYNSKVFVKKIDIVGVNVSDGLKLTKTEEKSGFYWIYVEYEKGYNFRTNKDQIIMITPRCTPDNAFDKSVVFEPVVSQSYTFDDSNPVPTIIYDKDIYTNEHIVKETTTVTFTIKNNISNKKVDIKLVTKFVDSLD